MAKYNSKLVKKIETLIIDKMYRITDVCKEINVSRTTFHTWIKTKPGFAEIVEDAFEQCAEKLMAKTQRSLRQRLNKYTLTEVKTKYIPDKDNPEQLAIKEQIVKQKECAPDIRAMKMIIEHDVSDLNRKNKFRKLQQKVKK